MKLEAEILAFVYDHFPVARKNAVTPNDSLLESGIIDSLGVMEIVNFLVEKKSVEIDEDDLIPENFDTVVHIAQLVKNRTGQ